MCEQPQVFGLVGEVLADDFCLAGAQRGATAAEQEAAMADGTRRLLLLTVPSPLRALQRLLSNETKLALARNPYGTGAELLENCIAAG